jgi:adenylate cyclase
VVERLIAAGETATLGGERRELTILFTDIAGFTSLSERIPPEQVMQYISHYLDSMSRAIHLNSGVIDKFIGDAIMAIWNAPERDLDHASHACQALLDCMRANATLDREAADSGLPILATRFGLHSGEVVVGNVGSAVRMQYTALGANVNLASRLEALNKHYGTSNLVSGEVRARAAPHFVFRSVALVMAAGTTKPVEVFELLGTTNDPDATAVGDWVGCWEVAMSTLRNGDPQTASTLFAMLALDRPTDGLASFYVARSSELARRHEDSLWDGIDHFSEK